jgi:uncharacterized protein (DUF1800 family)
MNINLPIKVNLTRLRAMFGQLALLAAACGVPGWAAAQSIVSFTVVNADTGVDIATYTDSGTVSVTTTPRINIRANAAGVKSVVFTDSFSTTTRTENTAPYAYKGNTGTVYAAWTPAVGSYVINAKPYSGSSGSGTVGPTARLTLTVVGTSPPPPPPPPPPPVATDKPATRNEAARFLAQATFGPTDADIGRLMTIGYSAWINEQFAAPANGTHLGFFNTLNNGNDKEVVATIWRQALTGSDQLRLRMAYALSQIFVISLEDGDVDNYDRAVAAWMDMLNTHSFGNYRDLLQAVSTNPMMGIYLTHIANQKADPMSGRVPDENYAREVMQLFTIGLVDLNQDGSPRTGGDGLVRETYTPSDVSELAKVFTGWSWACPVTDKSCFLRGSSNGREYSDRDLRPMVSYPDYHSVEAKTFLGTTIPAGTSAAESLRAALDRLAAHPNVAPFISRQLIQRFTTSNPSPAYVTAVANAFSNNGSGVRGDFKAVLKAVLLHPEARLVSDTSGKVREPVLRLSAFMRAFPHRSVSGKYDIEVTNSPATALGQAPLHSPSVFNFYRPGYIAPGTKSAARNLVAPELQIINETSVAGYVNFMRDSISNGVGFSAGSGLTRRDLQGDYTAELALAADVPALVDRVTTRLAYGAIGPARRAEIVSAVSSIVLPGGSSSQTAINTAKRQRVNAAILLTVAAPEFVVIK